MKKRDWYVLLSHGVPNSDVTRGEVFSSATAAGLGWTRVNIMIFSCISWRSFIAGPINIPKNCTLLHIIQLRCLVWLEETLNHYSQWHGILLGIPRRVSGSGVGIHSVITLGTIQGSISWSEIREYQRTQKAVRGHSHIAWRIHLIW